MWFRVGGKIRRARRSGARRKIGAGALVSQRLFHVRRHTRGDDGSFEWYVSTGTPADERVKTSRTARRPKPGGRSYRPPSTAIRGCETMHATPAKTLPRSSPPRMRYWRVSLLRGRAQYLGEVEAINSEPK